jgi:membrane-associated protease RseP (regulator of RpoE activity)
MSEMPGETAKSIPTQTDFERITAIVSAEFSVEEALMEHDIPTYYLKQPQETKHAFLRLLKNLDSMNLIAMLRREDRRIVLRIASKPPVKRSNVMINWLLFFATIGTTFLTGYLLSLDMIDPLIGGTAFTIAIMAILGLHEMGHKLTANRNGIDATPPYFIPGPPPIDGFLGIGTFGAVIMQKSLPPNKDALFDIGASGPIVSFFLAIIATIIGLRFSVSTWIPTGSPTLPVPLLLQLMIPYFAPPLTTPSPGALYESAITLHPVAVAGWVGMFVTMLNLVPASMLDGGHVSRSLLGEKTRVVLTVLSIVYLAFVSLPMAIFVLFLSMYRHPGPLDDVSCLSTSRKLLAVALVIIFILSSFLLDLVYILRGFLNV